MNNNRDGFSSNFGVIMALAGSAVGLGNLWRFPYLVGTNGGAAFIIIYLIVVVLLALPIMYAEFILGRKSQSDVVGGFRKLAPDTKWWLAGVLCLITTVLITSFYSVVGGWTVDYIIKAVTLSFNGENTDYARMFTDSVTSVRSPIIFMAVFVILSALILVAGVKGGIEKFSKILMPVLFLLVMIIAVRSLTLPGSSKGVEFLFKPDFSKVTGQTILAALGQAFFSLSVGMGTIFTYASYVNRKENVVSVSVKTALMDTLFAIIAGTAIMPAVFAFGISPGEGPGLAFVTLPYIFANIPLGSVLAILFFFILFIAAITSAISLIEVSVTFMVERLNWSRKLSLTLTVLVILALGSVCSLSQGVLGDFKIFGLNVFDLFDFSSANIMMPLGALIFVLFAGWKLPKPVFMNELTSDGLHRFRPWFAAFIYYSVKYLAPIVIIVVLLSGLL